MMRESRRMQAVQPAMIPVVADLIRQNPGTISLGQGVVYYGPPPEAMRRITGFAECIDNHKYQPVPGMPALIDACSQKLKRENNIVVDADNRIVVTAGANMAFMNAVLAIADPGDEIILLKPYYFNYEMAVRIANCRPVAVATDAHYQPDLGAIRNAITERTRAIVTISPNNPTGAVYPEKTLCAVNELCRERGIFHINDEAYEYFTWNGARHFSPGAISGAAAHTISLFSLSKSYGFASWRVGYMVIPADLFEAVRKVQDTILICAPAISQTAAVGALETGAEYCREHLANIAEVRGMMLDALREVAAFCDVPSTDGALYFLLRLDTALDDMTVVKRLVREFGVAVIPGNTFGIDDTCCLRVSYGALEKHTAEEGIQRLVRGLKTIAQAE